MTTLLSSDWHFSNNPRDEYRFAWLKDDLRRKIKKYRVKKLFILGDLTEEKDRHCAELVNRIVEEIVDLSKRVAEVIILSGNHDGLSTDCPFFMFLHLMPNITWISSPTVINSKDLGKLLFLPHTRNYKRDWKKFNFKEFDWIFTHASFAGITTESGFKMNEGIPVSVFPKTAKVISGDIHKPQKIGPVTYVGSPYTVDFGDDFIPRVLLLEGDTMRSIKCRGPQKRLVNMCISDCVDEFLVDCKSDLTLGDILKVQVNLLQKSKANWAEIKSQIYKWGENNGYVVHLVKPVLEGIEYTARINEVKQRNDTQMLKAFAKRMKLDKLTVKVGLSLSKAA